MKHSSYRSLTLARHLRSGGTTTTPSGRTAPSATCRQPSMPNSAIPGCNGTGRLSCFGAPRPAPLHHRANRAQMKNGLYFQLDEKWGSGQSRHDGVESDTDRAFNKLALACGLRNSILMMPAVAMALTRAGPEIAYLGVICAIGTLLAFTHGSLSRKIFWAHASPPLAASILITLVVYSFVEASGVLIGFCTLVVLLIL